MDKFLHHSLLLQAFPSRLHHHNHGQQSSARRVDAGALLWPREDVAPVAALCRQRRGVPEVLQHARRRENRGRRPGKKPFENSQFKFWISLGKVVWNGHTPRHGITQPVPTMSERLATLEFAWRLRVRLRERHFQFLFCRCPAVCFGLGGTQTGSAVNVIHPMIYKPFWWMISWISGHMHDRVLPGAAHRGRRGVRVGAEGPPQLQRPLLQRSPPELDPRNQHPAETDAGATG